MGNNPQTFVDPYGLSLYSDATGNYPVLDPRNTPMFPTDPRVTNTGKRFFEDEIGLFNGLPSMYEYATNDPFGFANTMKDAAVDSAYDFFPDAYDKVTGLPGNVYEAATTDDDQKRGQSLRDAFDGGCYLTLVYGIYKSIYNLGKKGAKEAAEESLDVLRRRAVSNAWKMERERVLNGNPSRNWSPQQTEDILNGKVPKSMHDGKPIEGHHIETVADNPSMAGDPNNIEFRSFTEHRKRNSGIHSTNPNPDYKNVDNTTTP